MVIKWKNINFSNNIPGNVILSLFPLSEICIIIKYNTSYLTKKTLRKCDLDL